MGLHWGEHGGQLTDWTASSRRTGDPGKTPRTRDASHLRVRTLWLALGRAAADVPVRRLRNPPESGRWMRDAGGSRKKRLTRCV
ncbi:hypothetical protein NDU88_003093 [Pleurodeles waltl]|uniref:Uncharacterized protein n=1 Tax=Pleurodeles waltl TaxID=8319 RepID=A0AAV7M2Y6_PLEWA|nr:hypothetical protein NDU88_003093 [Pleurodeles waltl]